MKKPRIRMDATALLIGAVVVAMAFAFLRGDEPKKSVEPLQSPDPTSGECCAYTGPVSFDCESIENLGPGADLDGRCNAVNQGQSCSWLYGDEECCKIAANDGFGTVRCPDDPGDSGACCQFTGPVPFDCASIETLGPGADLDGRCNAVNQGQSCSWFYGEEDCCQVAIDDGFPGNVQCN